MLNSEKKTFIIDIKDCKNETWQGSLSWVQGKRSENFRSALELIKLIDSAVSKNDDKKEVE
ncbi:hypothetical protein [Thomasclavelia sp.]